MIGYRLVTLYVETGGWGVSGGIRWRKVLGKLEREKVCVDEGFHAAIKFFLPTVRLFNHPFKATIPKHQQHAKQVIATATFSTIIISSWPLLIAANVSSSELNINTNPPQAKKNAANASVGGREGRIERGGATQRKKYVRHRRAANPLRRNPHSA